MRMPHTLFVLALSLTLALAAPRAHAQDLGRVALVQALKDAACGVKLLCIAAHPDDEDGASLAYYRMQYGVKTYVVIATRGEGGQNEIGPELYNELGVIRTREMINAARVEGSELHFLDLPEFGYSKTRDEAMEKWGHDKSLARVRALLQELQPQVVITHHGLMIDHGQHQAIGQLIKEAVETEPATVQRLLVRKFEGGDSPYTMDLGELNTVRGKTYAQIAANALEEHHSQGMKFFIDMYLTGRPKAVYFERVVNAPEATSPQIEDEFGPLFKGIIAKTRPAALRALAGAAEDGLANAKVLDAIAALPDDAKAAAPDDLAKAAAIAAELRLKVTPSDTEVVPGQPLNLAFELSDYGAPDLASATLRVEAFGEAVASESLTLALSEGLATASLPLSVPNNAPLTMPHAEHLFDNNVLYTPQIRVTLRGTLANGVAVAVTQEIYVDVAPPLTLHFDAAPYLINPKRNQRDFTAPLTVTNHAPGSVNSALSIRVPVGWHASPTVVSLDFQEPGEQRAINFRITAVESFEGHDTINAWLEGSPHTATADVTSAAVVLDKKARVGVVRSYDDTLENTLRKLGVDYGMIGDQDFSPDSLAAYTTLLIDMRAYQYRPALVANNQAIFDFAKAGGNVIVMYHKTFDWRPAYAPIPFQISRNRTTLEDAPIKLLQPEHPFFNTPNPLLPTDWDGWIQERGLYFAGSWPSEYTPLIETNDPDENLPAGTLITAPVGEGHYTYCALALYRQLGALHPGALRLFANMIAQ